MNRKNIQRTEIIFYVIIGLFLLFFIWKVIVTPAENELLFIIVALLALFSLGISLLYYMKTNALIQDYKEIFLQGQPLQKWEQKRRTKGLKQEFSQGETLETNNDIELEAAAQLAFEEETLKLKEEEREEILQHLLNLSDMEEEEKKVYLSRLEQVDHDLFNHRSNLANLRKRINQSFSEMFILEKTKVIRDIIEQLDPHFVRKQNFYDINEHFHMIRGDLPQSSLELLKQHTLIDDGGHLTRKGYREFVKIAKKMP